MKPATSAERGPKDPARASHRLHRTSDEYRSLGRLLTWLGDHEHWWARQERWAREGGPHPYRGEAAS
jgi:hypothetical protein